jgi:hypothetical protein
MPFDFHVPMEGFEPPSFSSVDRRYYPLSYMGKAPNSAPACRVELGAFVNLPVCTE